VSSIVIFFFGMWSVAGVIWVLYPEKSEIKSFPFPSLPLVKRKIHPEMEGWIFLEIKQAYYFLSIISERNSFPLLANFASIEYQPVPRHIRFCHTKTFWRSILSIFWKTISSSFLYKQWSYIENIVKKYIKILLSRTFMLTVNLCYLA
jgi:hypothetical protein